MVRANPRGNGDRWTSGGAAEETLFGGSKELITVIRFTLGAPKRDRYPPVAREPFAVWLEYNQHGSNPKQAQLERLKLAWTFRTGKPGSEAVPIVVDGRHGSERAGNIGNKRRSAHTVAITRPSRKG